MTWTACQAHSTARTRASLFSSLKSLTDRERAVIVRRCGLRGEWVWTREEIGRYYGIHPLHIQQVENQALRKLKLVWGKSDVLDAAAVSNPLAKRV